MRMFELEQYVKSRAAEKPDGELGRAHGDRRPAHFHGLCFGVVADALPGDKKKLDFNKYLAEMAKTRPLEGAIEITPPGIVQGNATVFEKYFGDDYVELEKKLILHLKKLPYNDPFAAMPHYVAMVSYNDGKRTRREGNTFHSDALAGKWVTDAAAKNPAINADDAVIREFANRVQAETFAKAWLKGN